MDYPDLSALPAELRQAVADHGSLNAYRMVMHSPALAPGVLALGDAVLRANSLPPPWRELAILRVAHTRRAAYVAVHHDKMARAAGLSPTAVEAAGGRSAEELPPEEAAILAWTDRLLADRTLDRPERDEACRLLTVNQLADLVVTVGFYDLVCGIVNTFEVTTEGEPA
jgi:AhpD family alkylhydroperoxidase